jgi:histidinol-phosphate aminotransferase
VAQIAGVAALTDREHFRNTTAKIRKNREWVTQALTDMGFRVPPSQANFVLAHWKGKPSAREIFEGLRARAVIVRYFDAPRLQHALRITVGSEREIEALIDALRSVLSGEPAPPPAGATVPAKPIDPKSADAASGMARK